MAAESFESSTAMTSTKEAQNLQSSVWDGSLPIEIRLSASECRIYDQADPYLVCHSISTKIQKADCLDV